MAADDVPLYVRLPAAQAVALSSAAQQSGQSKRQLVEAAIRSHLDLDDQRVVVGRASLHEGPPEVLTLAEAARLLQIEAAAVQELAESGGLPGRRIAGDWRFSRAALLVWLAG